MAKTILITGSSRGIGKATAKLFHDKGWNVVATMRNPEQEDELQKLENILVTKLDVLDYDSIRSAIKQGIAKFDKIDVIVNNAGYGAFGVLEAASIDQIKRQFDVNVIGLLLVTKEVLPYFRTYKNGLIINISSSAGKISYPFGTLYVGSKFAVEGISECLKLELQQIGCKIKIIEPGAIKTDFDGSSQVLFNDENLTEYQNLVKLMIQADSLDTYSDAKLVAQAIYDASTDGSDRLRYIVGEDAMEILTKRNKLDDNQFLLEVKKEIGLL